MKFGICKLSVIPLRQEPNHKSELVNQMLFGELCQVTESDNEWLKITLTDDSYQGWVEKKQISLIDENEFKRLNQAEPFYSLDLVQHIHNSTSNQHIPILLGGKLYAPRNNAFKIADCVYEFDGNQTETINEIKRSQLLENAYLYLHSPYLWGGRSPFGIDCSGLAQMAYRLSGISIFRDTSQQVEQGDTITFLSEAKKGDLAFFDDDEGNIVHVGIIISGNSIIHASGKVRIDQIDHQGIYNWEKGGYTHKLRIIKSLL